MLLSKLAQSYYNAIENQALRFIALNIRLLYGGSFSSYLTEMILTF